MGDDEHDTDGIPDIDNDNDRGGEYGFDGLTVFVTSATYTGNLTEGTEEGVYGADAKCQALADAAGLGGKYRAWLSSGDDFIKSPSERFEPRVDASNKYELDVGGTAYYRVDGVMVAANWFDLTNGDLMGPIDRDENGVVRQSPVWTGTLGDGALEVATTIDGVPVGNTCADWTSDSGAEYLGGQGLSWKSGYKWTDHVDKPCDKLRRLYCFEQIEPPDETGYLLSDSQLVYGTDFDTDLDGWKEQGDGQFRLESAGPFDTVAGDAAYRGSCPPGQECALHAPKITVRTLPGAATLTYDTYISAGASAEASIEAQIRQRDDNGEWEWVTLEATSGPSAATSSWQSHTIDIMPYVDAAPTGLAAAIDLSDAAGPIEIRFVTSGAVGDEVGLDNMNATTQVPWGVQYTTIHRKVTTRKQSPLEPPPMAWAETEAKTNLFPLATNAAWLEATTKAQLHGVKWWASFTDTGLPPWISSSLGEHALGPIPGMWNKYVGRIFSNTFAVCSIWARPSTCTCENSIVWTVECQARVAWASHTPHDVYLNGGFYGSEGPDSPPECVDPNPVSVTIATAESVAGCDYACLMAEDSAHLDCGSVTGNTPTHDGRPQTECCQMRATNVYSNGPTPPPDQTHGAEVTCECSVEGYVNRMCTETVECNPNDPTWKLIRINCPWGYTDTRPCEINECMQCDQNCDQIGGGCEDEDGENSGPGGSGVPFSCSDPDMTCFPTLDPDGERYYTAPFEGDIAFGDWSCSGSNVGPLYPGGPVAVGAWNCAFEEFGGQNGGFGCDGFIQDDDCEDTDLRLTFAPGAEFSMVAHCPAGTECSDPDPANCPCPIEVEICGNGVCNDAVEAYTNCPEDCCAGNVGDPCGVCNEGVTLCDGSCEQVDYPTELSPAECTDGVDNDCDGQVDAADAGCPSGCDADWNDPCDGPDADDCLEGTFECDGTCNDATGVSEEVCNDGCDNDGNGEIDDCVTGGGCSTNADCPLDLVCDTSTSACVECVVDTDCGCNAQGNSCPTCNSVCCGGNSYSCTNDNECYWDLFASETCGNGIDDDCDGALDEGCMTP